MRCNENPEGITGLELIITIAVILVFIYIVISAVFGAVEPVDAKEGGVIGASVNFESEPLVTDGESNGVQDTGGEILGITLICDSPNPSSMGSFLIPVRLLIGSTGSIDISASKVSFIYDDHTEYPKYTNASSIKKSSWTVGDRKDFIPLLEADEDLMLEPNEIFTLVIYPETPVPPDGVFSVEISPPGDTPLKLRYRVPPTIESQRIVDLIPE